MKMLRTLLAAVALVAVLGITQNATAQSSATIQARAQVQAALAVTAARDLDFGTVIAGSSYSVGTGQPESGRWNLTGEASKGVALTFTLPNELTGTGSPVPIHTWNAFFSGAGTTFTPVSGQTYNHFLTGGALSVFIGATIAPPVGASGSYSAPIVLTVAYL